MTHDAKADASSAHRGLLANFRIVGFCTLLSRVLGLVRDMGMAALFGNGPVMDAFSVAFRIPNLARRLFGEGALTAAFLPAFIQVMEQSGRESAWRLATAVFAVLAVTLSGLVLACELLLVGLYHFAPLGDDVRLLTGLTAVMLPYVVLICLAAQVSAVLHALDNFLWPALSPVVLNVVWIAALWLVAPSLDGQTAQVYLVALAVLAAGGLQLLIQVPTLRRLGYHFDRHWREASARVREIASAMLPVVVGLSVTQLNTLLDSLIAWGFSQPEGGAATMSALGGLPYPVETGTASALYFGQRLYQFPLGVFGVALGTVMFPRLSRHAERGRLDLLRDDMQMGLRLVTLVGLPASVGLWLLALPLSRLFFEYGEFDGRDARQTAAMIAAYGAGVWGYCLQLIVHRGFYAVGDRGTPMRIGLAALGLNLLLNLAFIWQLGGMGLALATAVTATVQAITVLWCLQWKIGRFAWRGLARHLLRVGVATAAMAAACLGTLSLIDDTGSVLVRGGRVALPVVAGIGVYAGTCWLLGVRELGLILPARRKP